MGIAVTEYARVYHLLRCASDVEFFRCGISHCGKVFDEETQDVEVYPDQDSYEDLPLCKKCKKELERRQELQEAIDEQQMTVYMVSFNDN